MPGDIECTSATEKQCNALGSAALLWERLRFLNYLPAKTDQGIPVNSTYTMPFPDGAYVPTADDPGPGAWEPLDYVKEDYHHGPVNGNRGGSYLTMLSEDGLSFGIINIIGNFGTVFVDQSYWQSAIAAKPGSAHKGYVLGGMVWFVIPFALATALGLAGNALNMAITPADANNGLVPPAAAIALLGQPGGTAIIVMLTMAILSTGSAECIAVSSLMSYDIYRTYFNPEASGSQILKISRVFVLAWALVMAIASIVLSTFDIGLGFVYNFMATVLGSAVFPVACSIYTDKLDATFVRRRNPNPDPNPEQEEPDIAST